MSILIAALAGMAVGGVLSSPGLYMAWRVHRSTRALLADEQPTDRP